MKRGKVQAMKTIRKILPHIESLSTRKISDAFQIPKSTVNDYLKRIKCSGLTVAQLLDKNDEELKSVFSEKKEKHREHKHLDTEYYLLELKKKGVTRKLLHEEYLMENKEGLRYSQFCERLFQFNKKRNVSMRLSHRGGEKMFVDYSGMTFPVYDPKTNIPRDVEIFVACFPASGYTYAEASYSQRLEAFISSHVRALEFFGGVPELIVPDNLKSAVTKADRYDPILNESYQEFASHYGCLISPARSYKPKDKAHVEYSVQLVQRWILARLRNEKFYNISNLNGRIWSLLNIYNDKVMNKYGKSRKELFECLDRQNLKSLNKNVYIFKKFKKARVHMDYHVVLEKCFYSVPYTLVREEIECRYSDTKVEIYHKNRSVAIHPRRYVAGTYSTKKEHMASHHIAYQSYSAIYFLKQAKEIGKETEEMIARVLNDAPHEELGFKQCLGLLREARKDKEISEKAAIKMNRHKMVKVRHFKNIILNKSYLQEEIERFESSICHQNIRGEEYYH